MNESFYALTDEVALWYNFTALSTRGVQKVLSLAIFGYTFGL